ncbi:hypothetical protein BKA56DRAFT_172341 [Ilyonectria sp. MPI-CAGE-AT-0026]|nr:hypothetical protein BKA56DRAFT_172341 [Ilyonectria sp. MPI-CAGE-AT-0026]
MAGLQGPTGTLRLDPEGPTYHIIPDFEPPAPAGRFTLGTIVDDFDSLWPLNQDEEPVIDHSRLHCHHEDKFCASRAKIVNGGRYAGWRLLNLGPVGEGWTGRRSTQHMRYCFKRIDTISFTPTKEDYMEAFQSVGVQDYLCTSNNKPVYMITGIKTGHEPSITSTRNAPRKSRTALDLEMHGRIPRPHPGAPGADASLTSDMIFSRVVTSSAVFAISVVKLVADAEYPPEDDSAEMAGAASTEPSEDVIMVVKDIKEVELDAELQNMDVRNEYFGDGEMITWIKPRDT